MSEISEFIKEKSVLLLSYIDNPVRGRAGALTPLEMVDSILDDWSRKFGGKKLPTPTLKERTFWFTLYQYENLVEMPDNLPQIAPYQALLKKNLARVTKLLRKRRKLPPEFFATRPGEDDYEDGWDSLDAEIEMRQIESKVQASSAQHQQSEHSELMNSHTQ